MSSITLFGTSCSSIEDNEDSEVDEADCVGESEGEGTVELAEEDVVEVTVRLVAGLLLLGRAVVVDIAAKLIQNV